MAYCGKCGTKLNEGANFCPKCGNPCGNSSSQPTEEVTVASLSKKNKSVKAILATVLAICIIGGGWLAWKKIGNGEANDVVQREQIQFLENFYNGFDNPDEWDSHVRMHVTKNALQILRDEYSYDCDDDCLATWIFLYEGDEGDEFKGRTIEPVSQNVFLVTNSWGDESYSDYKVKLGLVKDGDDYKIDNIERVSVE